MRRNPRYVPPTAESVSVTVNGGTPQYTSTRRAAGICQIQIQDTNAQTVAVSVTVTTTTGNVSSKRRQ